MYQIYQIKFTEDVHNFYIDKPYVYALQRMYRSMGILLIGVKSRNRRESVRVNCYDIFLNPTDYIIQEDDEGIVIAKNEKETL